MDLKKQDKNGLRHASEVPRRYGLGQIKTVVKEVKKLEEKGIKSDSDLSSLAEDIKKIKESLDNKVESEEGKGLSKNDFTDELLEKLNGISENAEVNNISSVELDGTEQVISNKILSINTIKEMNIGDSEGYIWFSSGFLVEWGNALLEANSIEVHFPLTFSKVFFGEAIPYGENAVNYSLNNIGNSGLTINAELSNNFVWKAIGYKNIEEEVI